MTEDISMLLENADAGDVRSARLLEGEIEKRGLWREYIGELLCILLEETDYDIIEGDPDRNIRDAWHCLRSHPQQRAAAFRKVVDEL